MSDVRDMLGLEGPTEPAPKSEKKEKKPKSAGPFMARELQALQDTWENQSGTLAPNIVIPSGFKNKRVAVKSTVNQNWKLVPIRSQARMNSMMLSKKPTEDDVDLFHWHKGETNDYRFTKFSKPIRLLDYTNDEYYGYCQDPNWTKQQTDRLFELCHMYDLRFIIIHDRFVTESQPSSVKIEGEEKKEEAKTVEIKVKQEKKGKVKQEKSSEEELSPSHTKTVEDLKDRFYTIQRRLLMIRNSSDPDLKKHPQFQHIFDSTYETERKTQLARLFGRKEGEVEEVANLVLENRQLIATMKKVKEQLKERNKVLKIARPKSSTTDTSVPKVKRKAKVLETPVVPAGGEMAEIPPDCFPHGMFPPRVDGVFLRSTQLAYNPTTLTTKQAKFLENELNNTIRKGGKEITVPTSVVCDMYDTLRFDIVTLYSLQKVVAEREALRDQIRAAKGLGPAPAAYGLPPPTSMAPSYSISKAGGTTGITPTPLKKQKSSSSTGGGDPKRRPSEAGLDDRDPKRMKRK